MRISDCSELVCREFNEQKISRVECRYLLFVHVDILGTVLASIAMMLTYANVINSRYV